MNELRAEVFRRWINSLIKFVYTLLVILMYAAVGKPTTLRRVSRDGSPLLDVLTACYGSTTLGCFL